MAGKSKFAPHWTDKLQEFDRRWIFLAMALAIVLPLLKPLNLPVKPSPMVRNAFFAVEALKEGDVVFLSLDLDPASTPELEPFFRAVVLHLKRKNVRLVIATTWYAAPPLVERWISEVIEQPIIGENDTEYKGAPDRAYKKNDDYVWLGFREGREAVITSIGKSIRKTFDGRAQDGTPLSEIPILEGIDQLKDVDLTVLVSAGFPGIKEYVQYVQSRYGNPMIGATTAVSTTDLTPYYNAGQLIGLIGGMAAAAEYEELVGRRGLGFRGTDVLNFGHLVVIAAILFGNFIYFASRRRRRRL